MYKHRHRLLRLGFKAHFLRHARLCSPGPIPGPCFRQVQRSVQEHVDILGRITQDRRDLTILALARRSRVLPRHSHRSLPFLEKARLIHHSDALWVPKGLDHELLQPIARLIRIPGYPVQQALHTIGDAVPHRLSDLPAILALGLGEQPPQIFPGLLARLATLKQVGKARVKRCKFVLPLLQFFFRHTLPPNRILSFLYLRLGASYGCSISAYPNNPKMW